MLQKILLLVILLSSKAYSQKINGSFIFFRNNFRNDTITMTLGDDTIFYNRVLNTNRETSTVRNFYVELRNDKNKAYFLVAEGALCPYVLDTVIKSSRLFWRTMVVCNIRVDTVYFDKAKIKYMATMVINSNQRKSFQLPRGNSGVYFSKNKNNELNVEIRKRPILID